MNVDDKVRISIKRGSFHKGYLEGWSEEIFIITHKLTGDSIKYKVKDQAGEALKGIFYEQELQKVAETDTYKIEKVIRKKKNRDGRWLYFVK